MSSRVAAALTRASALAAAPYQPRAARGVTARPRRFAIGDPQAPAEVFFEILDTHDLLTDDGALADDVYLVSVGDHFDYGKSEVRAEATASGHRILAWLADHPEDQAAVILGNHDLGRVGELAAFDAATWDAVHERAAIIYRDGDESAEARLLVDHPSLPTAEVAARDFAAFSPAQRDLVTALLRSQRARVAVALGPRTLACHAGVTAPVLASLGLAPDRAGDATAVAAALNARLDETVASWSGGRLDIPGLHRSGRAATGEGIGVFYHRPAHPDLPINAGYAMTDDLGRRFDPRRLPPGLVQVVGHISDGKCRSLLGPWAVGEPAAAGEHRQLVTDGDDVRYAAGLRPIAPQRSAIVFIDGGMSRIPPTAYRLLELSQVEDLVNSDRER